MRLEASEGNARHQSATLRAHSTGLRNYPSSESQIPPQMECTLFPPFSEWKFELARTQARFNVDALVEDLAPRYQSDIHCRARSRTR